MVTSIVDSGLNLEITQNNEIFYIAKQSVHSVNEDNNGNVYLHYDNSFIIIDWDDVITPATPSANALALAIKQMVDNQGGGGGASIQNVVFVSSDSDFPAPNSFGVVTLDSNTLYVICDNITTDLLFEGNRVHMVGIRRDIQFNMTSTAFSAKVIVYDSCFFKNLIITCDWFLEMLRSSYDENSYAIFEDTSFINIPYFMELSNIGFFNFKRCFVQNSPTILFLAGSVRRIVVENCYFSMNAGTAIRLISSTNVLGFVKIKNCDFFLNTGATAININTLISIPERCYEIEGCRFQGTGTIMAGVQKTDNRANVKNNVGNLLNSVAFANARVINNTTPTNFSSVGVYVIGVFAFSASSQERFSVGTNTITYTGGNNRIFKIQINMLVTSASVNINFGVRLGVNGVPQPTIEMQTGTTTVNRPCMVSLSHVGTYSPSTAFSVWIANLTNGTPLIIRFLDFTITEIY